MMEETPPLDLTLEAWAATPARVRAAFQMLLAMVAELPTLQTRVAELEARLKQNSQNSSKPPSSDPPSAPPPPTETPRGKPKQQGAQPGHPEQQRELLPEAEVAKVVVVHPTCCPNCHAMLPATLGSACLPERQQVWELPEGWPTVTAFQYLTVCGRGCGELVTAPRPDDVPPGAFGPRVVALIALLHGRYRSSDRALVVLLQMVWHLPISLGRVVKLQQVASAALEPAYAEVQEAVTEAEHANVDETSWREGQKKPWLWGAVTSVAVRFRLPYGRGRAQLTLLLGAVFAGLVTSDRLSASNSIAPARRQLCLAQLVRNFRGRAEARGPWQEAAAALLALTEEVLVIWAGSRAGRLDRPTMHGLIAAIQQALRAVAAEHAPHKHTLGSLCTELLSRWEALWTFTTVAGVEPTKNAAERALRPAVLWRNGCYGTQRDGGSRFVARMLTVSATCQLHQRPRLPYLVEAIAAYWAKQPAPRLLPSGTP